MPGTNVIPDTVVACSDKFDALNAMLANELADRAASVQSV